jgi:hypothetical protein
MAAQDDLNTPVVAVVGLIGAIGVFAVILLLMIVFRRVESRQRAEKEFSRADAEVRQLVANQEGRLADYGWVDKKKGIARIPITRAMELVVAELTRNPNAVVTGVAPGAVQPPDEKKEGEDVH